MSSDTYEQPDFRYKDWKIDNAISISRMTSNPSESVSDRQLRSLIIEALPESLGLTPLDGFKMNLSANPGFRKVFFSARCDCGTAALLSVEVAEEKTLEDIQEALPALIDRLEAQTGVFYDMPCETHEKMRLGPATKR